ncbi:MAG: response regulator [Nitrospirota bacterium]
MQDQDIGKSQGRPDTSGKRRAKGRILVVDDQSEIIALLCDFFSENGYSAEGFLTAKDALSALREQSYDIVITDLSMPEIDGLELIHMIHQIEPLMVCVVITGNSLVQTAVDAMKAGAFDYVLKPFKMKNLMPVVVRAIETRRLRDSEKKYRSIVEDQTEMICRFLPGGIITFVNEPYCRCFGQKQRELTGKSFLPMVFEEDREYVNKAFSALSGENNVVTIEHRVVPHGGEIRWHQWTHRILFDEHGRIEYQSVGRDITERKKIEAALQMSEKELYRRVRELEEFYEAAVGRELKMIELKEEIEALKKELEQAKRRNK